MIKVHMMVFRGTVIRVLRTSLQAIKIDQVRIERVFLTLPERKLITIAKEPSGDSQVSSRFLP